jgi:hypothetical protein
MGEIINSVLHTQPQPSGTHGMAQYQPIDVARENMVPTLTSAILIVLLLLCPGRTWADTTADAPCGKPAIDHPTQDNPPPDRLRCEQIEDGNESAQRQGEGEKPVRWRGVDGLPHPVVIDGVIVGGSTRGRWISTAGLIPADLEAGQCRPLGAESMPPGLRYKLYSFDKPLGECAGGGVSACGSAASGEPWLQVDFPGCAVEPFDFGIAAPWNALPRPPKALDNHPDFTAIVRAFLDGKGLQQAPILIKYIHGVDLDGDGNEERVIHARSRRDEPTEYSATDYSLLLLVRTDRDPPESTAISAWWPGEQEKQGTYERYDSHYADIDGDGTLEIIVDWNGYEESGIRIYTLRQGRPVDTGLGFYEGV